MHKKHIGGYTLDKFLGGGSFGEVWQGRATDCGEPVAVRTVNRHAKANVAQLRQDVHILRRTCHVNIVRFHDLKKTASSFYLFLEQCAGGSLAQLLLECAPLSEDVAWRFLVQIAAGLQALHCNRVLHLNLRPSVIFLSDRSENPTLKISSFACDSGPTQYTAPEIISREPPTSRADIWSLGVILFEMLHGNADINADISIPFGITGEGRQFCQSLLEIYPFQRPSSREVVGHPYVTNGPRIGKVTTAPEGFQGTQGGLQPPLSSTFGQCPAVRSCVREAASHNVDPPVDTAVACATYLEKRHFSFSFRFFAPLPIVNFSVGQLCSSHFFRFRNSQLFPSFLCAGTGKGSWTFDTCFSTYSLKALLFGAFCMCSYKKAQYLKIPAQSVFSKM